MYDNQTASATRALGMGSGLASGGLRSPNEADRVLALDAITQRVADANDQIMALVTRTRDLADSVFGGLPTAAEKSGGTIPMPGGRVSGLDTATRTTRELLEILRGQIERFEAL
jgi:hypothetical protein